MGKSGRSIMQANCPFCTQSVFRKDMDKHLRMEHGGKGVGRTVCMWPDCGQNRHTKKFLESHMYSHTDPRARSCPYPMKSSNGQLVPCRFIIMDHSSIGLHEGNKHTTDRLLPDGSLAPQVVDPRTSVGLAMAGSSSGGGHGTQGKWASPSPEINLDGLLQIEPEEDDSAFVNSLLSKPACTSIEEPKESNARIANRDVAAVPSNSTRTPSASKRKVRRHVKNPKEDLAKNDSRQMTPGFLKNQTNVSVPKI